MNLVDMLRVFIKKKNLIFISFALIIFYSYNSVSKNKFEIVFEHKDDALQNKNIFKSSAIDDAYSSYKSESLKYNSFSEHKVIQHRKNSSRLSEISKPFYIITEYTKVFRASKYCTHKINSEKADRYINNEIFKRFLHDKNQEIDYQQSNQYFSLLRNCIYDNCFFSCNRDHIDISSAVLFHYADLVGEVQANPNFIPYSKRSASQVWLFWNDEAGSINPMFDSAHFNWTIGYKPNSEVSFGSYGTFLESSKFTESSLDAHLREQFNIRANSISWFNSNCNSRLRLKYASEISIHYNIDFSGLCSSYFKENAQMLNKNLKIHDEPCGYQSECEKKLLSENKYFLAFESKDCPSYITEKFWRSLDKGLIPIVFQPDKHFYESVAPPNSFIHFKDFNFNAIKLAEHLNNIDKNFTLYSSYFKWKLKYSVIYEGSQLESFRMCELCSRLNKETKSISYSSISSFFEEKCINN